MAILPSLSHTLQVCIYLRCPLLHRTCTCRTLGEGSEEISCHPLSLELLVCSYLRFSLPPCMCFFIHRSVQQWNILHGSAQMRVNGSDGPKEQEPHISCRMDPPS